MLGFCLIFLISNDVFGKEVKEHKTVFLDASVTSACKSSFAPVWVWHGKNRQKTLAVGDARRENFHDAR